MKNVLFFFLLLNASVYSQEKQPFQIYLGCYTNGDTIPTDAIGNIRNISVLKNGKGQNEARINSWEIVVFNNGKITTTPAWQGSPTIPVERTFLIGKDNVLPQKIIIQAIKIEMKNGDKTILISLPQCTFYRAHTTTKKC